MRPTDLRASVMQGVAQVAVAAALLSGTPDVAAQSASSAELNRAFQEAWDWVVETNPGLATFFGDPRFNDRLNDLSPAAVLRDRKTAREFLRRVEAIDPAGLTPSERVSRAMFIRDARNRERLTRFFGDLPLVVAYPVTPGFGPQIFLPQLARAAPFANVQDYEAYIRRLNAVPQYMRQLIEQLKIGADHGWIPPRVVLTSVPGQIDAQIVTEPTQSGFFAPFRSFPSTIPVPEQARLRSAGETAIRNAVVPAFAELKRYFESDYMPRARKDVSASTLPGGPAFYDVLLQNQTTTDLTAQQIHELGLKEVARIETEMEAVMRSTGFKGARDEFVKFLWSDPRFFYETPAQLLTGYRDIAKRADAELPKLFKELPRLPYGIRAMPAERGAAAEHYTRGAGDGSRAAYFEANLNDPKRRAKWQMPTLVLHETVPGHHTQIARQQELSDLPAFRRFAFNPAFSEGWALYAERLGTEMGMYSDPYDMYGHLSGELLRAARLVVDTGLHSKGWSREEAVAYMRAHTTENNAFIDSEVDRYIVSPGQATTYKVGQLKIVELRERATAALGSQFDLRGFNNAVIDAGPVPLSVLEENIDAWIATQKARPQADRRP